MKNICLVVKFSLPYFICEIKVHSAELIKSAVLLRFIGAEFSEGADEIINALQNQQWRPSLQSYTIKNKHGHGKNTFLIVEKGHQTTNKEQQ